MRLNSAKIIILILLIMVLLALSCQCANNKVSTGDHAETTLGDWAECFGDSSRTASVSFRLDLPLEQVWRRKINSELLPPVCKDNHLITATDSMNDRSSEELICLDARNGDVIWTKTVDVETVGGVYIAGDLAVFVVYVADVNSNATTDTKSKIICLEMQTGDRIWELELPDEAGRVSMCNVCFKDKEGFVVAEKGSVYVVDLEEGKITRKFNLLPKGYILNPMTALGGRKLIMGSLKIGSYTQEICAIDIDSDEICWKRRFDEVKADYCYYNGLVIVMLSPVLLQKTRVAVVALDINNGRTKWSLDMSSDWTTGSFIGLVSWSLSKEEGLMLFTLAGKTVNSGQQQCLAYCIDAKSGQLCWKKELEMELEPGDGPGAIIADDIGVIGEVRSAHIDSSSLFFCDMHNGNIIDMKETGSLSYMIAGADSLFTAEEFIDNTNGESLSTEVCCYR
ncbi:MAG: PQQ-binding-like beta-propeller repeat protein [Actinomycetia bacterium]|nr:PQQ-binding-like beta-propeller repeat protein [Actinomycetes bacterium]